MGLSRVTSRFELLATTPKLASVLGSEWGFFVVLILLTLVSGRMLGIRVSWLRGIASAFLGVVAGVAFYYGQSLEATATPDVGLNFGVPALLTTMLALTFTEIAYRPGSVPTVPVGFANVPHPISATTRWLGRNKRYIQVLWIVARNGLNPYLRGGTDVELRTDQTSRIAVRVRRALEECGGVFVKLGQVLSTRPDLLPASFIAELSKLQDAAKPVPYSQLAATIESELGANRASLFAEFDETPVAAASIAQVHRARLESGETVGVKVGRPGIRLSVARDLEIIQRLARGIASRSPWARRAGLIDLAEGFVAAVWEETDFRIEAGNIKAIGEAGRETVRVPRVFAELSSSRMLVMEWMDGVKLRDGGALLAELDIDRSQVARMLLRCVLQQILVTGVFHADPHPGNVLILRDGTPALIDFGSVGRLDASQQSAIRRMLAGIDRRDVVLMRDALCELSGTRDTRTQDLLERSLSQMLATRLAPGMQPGAELFGDVLRLLVEFELALPGHVAAVFRCLVMLEGTLRLLSPGFALVDESRAAASELLRDTFSRDTIQQAARDELVSQLPILRRLPRRLDQLAATMEDGRLAIRVSLFETEEERRFVSRVVGRSIFAFLGAAIGIMSVMLMSTSGGPVLAPSIRLLTAVGYFGLIVSSVLILRVIVGLAGDRAA